MLGPTATSQSIRKATLTTYLPRSQISIDLLKQTTKSSIATERSAANVPAYCIAVILEGMMSIRMLSIIVRLDVAFTQA